jgi:hypothetical protein
VLTRWGLLLLRHHLAWLPLGLRAKISIVTLLWWHVFGANGSMSAMGPGCAKTKSDLVVMPSGGRIFAFFKITDPSKQRRLIAQLDR